MSVTFSLPINLSQLDKLDRLEDIVAAIHQLRETIMASTEQLTAIITRIQQTITDESAAIRAILESDAVDQQKIDDAVRRLEAMDTAIKGMVPEPTPGPTA